MNKKRWIIAALGAMVVILGAAFLHFFKPTKGKIDHQNPRQKGSAAYARAKRKKQTDEKEKERFIEDILADNQTD